MKKLILLPLLILFLACSGDDSNKDETEISLVGRWFIESTTVNGVKLPDEDDSDCEVEKEFYLEFMENLAVNVFNYYECTDELRNGSYDVSNNNIVVVLEGETFIYEIVALTKDRLALKYLEDDNDDDIAEIVVITFHK